MTLRLICDEHVGKTKFYPQISNIATTNHVLEIPSLGTGAPDGDIWKHAVSINYNIFANDEDFKPGGSANPKNGTHPGVIYYDDDANNNDILNGLEKIRDTTTSSNISQLGEDQGRIFYLPGGWV